MLRVAIDATALVAGNTGVAQYAQMHLEALSRRDDVEAIPFAVGRGPNPTTRVRRIRIPLRIVQRAWRHAGLPRAEHLVGRVDVVHSIDIVPPPTRAPLVITIHDVLPLTHPELYAPRQRMMVEAQLRTAGRAQLIVTTCQATADEIVGRLDVDPVRLLVAPLGRRPASDEPPPRRIAAPYLLMVGSLTPRKGLLVLLDAIELLGDRAPLLVVAGPDGFRADVIHERLDPLEAAGRALRVGRVDDTDLEGLYRHALALCHPSVAEGFGIPVLEALGYGTPVVAADIPPVREVAGDAAVLVEPGSAAELAAAIDHLVQDPTAAAALGATGRQRAAGMTWEAMTERIVAGYQRIARGALR